MDAAGGDACDSKSMNNKRNIDFEKSHAERMKKLNEDLATGRTERIRKLEESDQNSKNLRNKIMMEKRQKLCDLKRKDESRRINAERKRAELFAEEQDRKKSIIERQDARQRTVDYKKSGSSLMVRSIPTSRSYQESLSSARSHSAGKSSVAFGSTKPRETLCRMLCLGNTGLVTSAITRRHDKVNVTDACPRSRSQSRKKMPTTHVSKHSSTTTVSRLGSSDLMSQSVYGTASTSSTARVDKNSTYTKSHTWKSCVSNGTNAKSGTKLSVNGDSLHKPSSTNVLSVSQDCAIKVVNDDSDHSILESGRQISLLEQDATGAGPTDNDFASVDELPVDDFPDEAYSNLDEAVINSAPTKSSLSLECAESCEADVPDETCLDKLDISKDDEESEDEMKIYRARMSEQRKKAKEQMLKEEEERRQRIEEAKRKAQEEDERMYREAQRLQELEAERAAIEAQEMEEKLRREKQEEEAKQAKLDEEARLREEERIAVAQKEVQDKLERKRKFDEIMRRLKSDSAANKQDESCNSSPQNSSPEKQCNNEQMNILGNMTKSFSLMAVVQRRKDDDDSGDGSDPDNTQTITPEISTSQKSSDTLIDNEVRTNSDQENCAATVSVTITRDTQPVFKSALLQKLLPGGRLANKSSEFGRSASIATDQHLLENNTSVLSDSQSDLYTTAVSYNNGGLELRSNRSYSLQPSNCDDPNSLNLTVVMSTPNGAAKRATSTLDYETFKIDEDANEDTFSNATLHNKLKSLGESNGNGESTDVFYSVLNESINSPAH